MKEEQYLKAIQYFNENFPYHETQYILDHYSDFKEELINSLKYAYKHYNTILKDDYFMHMYALHIFCEKEEIDAFPYIIDVLSIEDEEGSLLGDFITECLVSTLYYTFNGDTGLLEKMLFRSKNEFIASCIFDIFCLLYAQGTITKDTLDTILIASIEQAKKNGYENIYITEVVVNIAKLKLEEYRDLVASLHEEGWIEETFYGTYDNFIDYFYNEQDIIELPKKLTMDSFSRWACFSNHKSSNFEALEGKLLEKALDTNLNIGRNDPCPCGSGKKYKKCCMNNNTDTIVLPYHQYFIKSIAHYPKSKMFLQSFDAEAITIDKLMYYALIHKAIPITIKRDIVLEYTIYIKKMKKAFSLFFEKCKKENITSFAEYDRLHKIHYNMEYCYDSYVFFLNALITDFYQDHQLQLQDIKEKAASFLSNN